MHAQGEQGGDGYSGFLDVNPWDFNCGNIVGGTTPVGVFIESNSGCGDGVLRDVSGNIREFTVSPNFGYGIFDFWLFGVVRVAGGMERVSVVGGSYSSDCEECCFNMSPPSFSYEYFHINERDVNSFYSKSCGGRLFAVSVEPKVRGDVGFYEEGDSLSELWSGYNAKECDIGAACFLMDLAKNENDIMLIRTLVREGNRYAE